MPINKLRPQLHRLYRNFLNFPSFKEKRKKEKKRLKMSIGCFPRNRKVGVQMIVKYIRTSWNQIQLQLDKTPLKCRRLVLNLIELIIILTFTDEWSLIQPPPLHPPFKSESYLALRITLLFFVFFCEASNSFRNFDICRKGMKLY